MQSYSPPYPNRPPAKSGSNQPLEVLHKVCPFNRFYVFLITSCTIFPKAKEFGLNKAI